MAILIDTIAQAGRPRHPEKAHRPDQPTLAKPDWIRVKAPISAGYIATRRIVRDHGLHTVCEEASCPNVGECWEAKHATFMIMGDTCTRACAFCNVKTGLPGRMNPNTLPQPRKNSSFPTLSSLPSIATISTMAERRILPQSFAPFARAAPRLRLRS